MVKARLDRSRAELAARRVDLATLRSELDGLAETEKQLDEVTTQARQLNDRVAELERVARTAAEIPGLTELDDVLGPLLAKHTRAYEEARQARPY